MKRIVAMIATLCAAVLVAVPLPVAAGAAVPTPVQSSVVIGRSVQGRPIVAYHLGSPGATRTVLILGQMHGDEHAGVVVANSIVHGSQAVEGVSLWVIPTMNPDGDARHTRQNAHGVDLNRNWPHDWAHLTGMYYSGPRPLSEPESQAVWRFILRVRPSYVVSMHQPLDGVDSTAGSGPADLAFRGALSRNLELPVKNFQCWSVCHGSLSGWYQDHHLGVAVETVEFGWTPAHAYLVGQARRGIVAALGGRFAPLAPHDPRYRLGVSTLPRRAVFSGFARDWDDLHEMLWFRVYERGRRLAVGRAGAPNGTGHGIALRLAATPGQHTYCVVIQNYGAGAHDPKVCRTVTVSA